MNRPTLTRVAIYVAVIVVAGVAIWLTHSTTPPSTDKKEEQNQSQSVGDYAAPPGATAQPLGEIGPGSCWPATSFANRQGATQASNWYLAADPKVASAADRDAAYLLAHKDYYNLDQAVPNWAELPNNQERMAAYTAKLVVQQLKSPIQVQNTYCDKVTGQVTNWKTQVFPVGEWIGWVPGHEPGSAEPRPARKMVCGNWLGPVANTETTPPPPATTTNTPPPQTPECQANCGTPPCQTNCTTLEQKVPGEAPNGGTGSDRQTAGPLAPPQVPKATQPGPAPAPAPPPAGTPTGSTPTQTQQPPPPETGSNPDDGSGSAPGDPGGF